MTDRSDVWLVVPVYNEATVIRDVVTGARQVFPNVVCVDDGSSDGSAEEIRRSGAHLVRHPFNLGQGAAIQTGVEYARSQPRARYFVTFDGDGQHQIEDVRRMLDRIRADHSIDVIVGSRFLHNTSRIPFLKRIALRMGVALSPRSRRLGLTDVHNGLRVFNRRVANELKITLNGMGHASEFVELIDKRDWRVVEEPVTIRYTEYSIAKGQPLVNAVNILFDSVLRRSSRGPRS